MADEPKPDQKAEEPKPADAPAPSTSPAPTEVAGDAKPGDTKPGDKPAGDAPDPNQRVQAEALSDGTVPTVLKPGDAHRSVAKGKAGLTSIYRKADILTTLLTFVGAVVAGALILGVYAYFTRSKSTPIATPKVTTLGKADLDKLTAFFNGNSAGNSAEVLTINSSTLFKGLVGIGSDLKVTGGISVDGTTALGDLTVDKTSTLGIVNTRGQLTVDGPLTVQSPALFNGGASFKGNLVTTGNGTYGGSLSAASITVQTLSVSGNLNLNGHLTIGGSQNSATAPSGGTASVQGNDSAGTVTLSISGGATAGAALINVNFRTPFSAIPIINITPVGRASAAIEPYITPSATGFTISGNVGSSATNYTFDYAVVQY